VADQSFSRDTRASSSPVASSVPSPLVQRQPKLVAIAVAFAIACPSFARRLVALGSSTIHTPPLNNRPAVARLSATSPSCAALLYSALRLLPSLVLLWLLDWFLPRHIHQTTPVGPCPHQSPINLSSTRSCPLYALGRFLPPRRDSFLFMILSAKYERSAESSHKFRNVATTQ
jgi:hypothetical protein